MLMMFKMKTQVITIKMSHALAVIFSALPSTILSTSSASFFDNTAAFQYFIHPEEPKVSRAKINLEFNVILQQLATRLIISALIVKLFIHSDSMA